MKQLRLALVFILSSSFLAACGPYGKDKDKLRRGTYASPQTGYEKVNKVNGVEYRRAYTLSGNPELYNQLAEELKNDSDRLATSIKSIEIDLINKDSKPEQFNIKFGFFENNYGGLKSLNFEIPLAAKGETFEGQANAKQMLPENFNSYFYASVTCTDKLCSRVKLILDEQSPTTRARAGLIYTRKIAVVKKQRAQNTNRKSSSDIDTLDRSLENITAEQSSVVVVKGPAYSEVKVKDDKNNEIVKVKTELLDTSEMQTKAETVEVSGQSSNLDTKVSGNDPNSGSLIIDMDDEETGDGLRLIIHPEQGIEVEQPKEDSTEEKLEDGSEKHGDFIIQTNPEKGILIPEPELVSEQSQSDVKTVTAQMNDYASHPEVAWRAKMWGGLEKIEKPCKGGCRTPDINRMKSFVYNTKFAEQVIKDSLAEFDVSPELAYLLIIESRFLTSDSHPIEVANNTDATGPWQILDSTANWIVKNLLKEDLTITDVPYKPIGKAKPVDPKDSRAKLSTASRMAGRLLKLKRVYFPHDVGLAFLAYYQGQGTVRKFMKRTCGYVGDEAEVSDSNFTKDHCKYAVTLDQIHRFNMAPDENTDYAFTALATRLIGRNPEAYGMSLPDKDAKLPVELEQKL